MTNFRAPIRTHFLNNMAFATQYRRANCKCITSLGSTVLHPKEGKLEIFSSSASSITAFSDNGSEKSSYRMRQIDGMCYDN